MVDAVILTNFNVVAGESKRKGIKLIAFDFSLNCSPAIKDFSTSALKEVKNLKSKPSTVES